MAVRGGDAEEVRDEGVVGGGEDGAEDSDIEACAMIDR